MAIEAVWDKLKKQKAKSDALPKRDPGGFVSKSLREPGESFMDFTKRRHEVLYPGAQQMARQAGVGGFRAFGPAHQAYQNQLRAKMGKAPGARYNSQDWQRMMAGLNPSTYPAGAAQVGGGPAGVTRPAVSPLQQKAAYMADPANQAAARSAHLPRGFHRRLPFDPETGTVGGGQFIPEGMRRWPRNKPPIYPGMERPFADMSAAQRPQTSQHRRLPFNPQTGQVGGGPFIPEGMKRMGVNQRGIPTGNVMYPGMERVGDISANWWDRVNRNNQLRMQRQASNIVNRLSPERRHQLGLLGGMETRGLQRPF